jgi:hypothetical protein
MQTWEWDGSAWAMIADTGPSTRSMAAMAYDSKNKVTLLHGGQSLKSPFADFSDTWAWDGKRWTQVSDMGPTARRGHAMAYDEQNARALIFGGATGSGSPPTMFNDTWQWDGKLWRQVGDMGPLPRTFPGMCYDGQRQRQVMFGGFMQVEPLQGLSDTWEFFDRP